MKSFRIIIVLFLTIALFYAQNNIVKRKAAMGIAVIEIPDSVKKNIPSEISGVLTTNIIKEGTGEKIGLIPQDIITKFNEYKINNRPEFLKVISGLWGDEKFTLEVFRNGKRINLEGKSLPKPLETSEFSNVVYDTVKFGNGYLRTILNKPKTGNKFPVVLFIPGYPCASYDGMGSSHPYKKLIDGWIKNGFAVLRVEKSGMGDCYGTPDCFSIDAETEHNAFEKGLQKLTSYDFIDKNNIFIFGHSLGGIAAPFLAKNNNVNGIIVYGTIQKDWYEYLIDMFRIQNSLISEDYTAVDKKMPVYQKFLFEHFINKKTPQDLMNNPEYKDILINDFQYDGGDGIFGRNFKFWWSINELNLTQAWSEVNCNVLSIFGEADLEVLSPVEHEMITRIVNKYHPGKAEYYLMKETNHAFMKVGNMEKQAEFVRTGQANRIYDTHFNPEIVTKTIEWMKTKIK